MNMQSIYSEYLNSLQVKFAIGHRYNAKPTWQNTEILKLNKFYYVTDGEFILTIKGKEYKVTKGQLVMIPANLRHSYRLTEAGKMQKYWCHFEAVVGMTNLFDLIKTDFIVDIGIDRKLIKLFIELYVAAEDTSPAATISAKANLMLIISKYLENCKTITEHKTKISTDLSPVIEHMKEHINDNVNISELAQLVHLHPNYFIRLFKQYFGASPLKYFNTMKIDMAKNLLQNGNFSIENVAKRIGFNDIYSFSKFFKLNVGISPGRFRTNHLDN